MCADDPAHSFDHPRAERYASRAIAQPRFTSMSVEYLKKAAKTPETESAGAREIAAQMLADIEARGEAAVRDYAERLDGWTGDIVMTPDEIERRIHAIAPSVRHDIEFATTRVRRFAEAQRTSIQEFTIELQPGLVAGQRLVPVNVAGRDDDVAVPAVETRRVVAHGGLAARLDVGEHVAGHLPRVARLGFGRPGRALQVFDTAHRGGRLKNSLSRTICG